MKPAMAWAVQRGDGRRVGDIVAKMRELGAADSVRVFLNGRRATLDEPVDEGDRVELWPERDVENLDAVRILAQRDGIVLAYKPAGVPTETTQLNEDSLLSALMGQIKSSTIRAASRLDTMVSGVVVCTLGRDAAQRLEGWRRAGQLERCYLAVTGGRVDVGDAGTWNRPLGRAHDRGGRHRASANAREVRPAVTHFTVRARAPRGSLLLELVPETGRMHQLRAHAALAGLPLYGDALYGGPTSVVGEAGRVHALRRVALHAHRVALPLVHATAPRPDDLIALWRELGGEAAAWDEPQA
jgi:23S rRNA-/tRNA-specific pseudouridylate synthase